MLIDTHKAIEKMIAVGSTKENAEVIFEIINSQDDNLTTKMDLKLGLSEIKSEFRTEVEKLNSKIEKTDFKINEVNTEIKSIKSEINTMKWMIGVGMTIIIMMISLMFSLKF